MTERDPTNVDPPGNPMATPPFIDTNVLLYAGSQAPGDAWKKEIAAGLLADLGFSLSTQVVQEYISNALAKESLGISPMQIERVLESLRDVHVEPVTLSLIREAWELRSRYTVSHWDSTILAAAVRTGCEILYSEDMSDGQDYGGVRVVNPFRSLPRDP